MAKDAVKYKVVVIGGSAGSLDVVLKIVAQLPADSGAAFVVILHRKSDADSILADLVAFRTKMKVKEVEDKDAIVPNCIYLAPSDYHLLFEGQQFFSLDSSEKIHHSRPSIDVSFESVAAAFGASAIGILLSGANADGAAGLAAIKQQDGLTLVQDPLESEFSFMPQQAIALFKVDYILAPGALGAKLAELLGKG